jgi:RimJ/RimL family protein N-acetyltransferase
MPIPTLETERLRLRAHRLEDFGASSTMWASAEVTRYIGGKPFTEEESWTRFLRFAGHWSVMGFGFWLVEEKETGAFVGEVGFAEHKRDIQPTLQGTPEIGWVLVCDAHGKGYATEAARAAVKWGDEHFGLIRTACIIHPDNFASIRVAQKCGYRPCQTTDYKGQATMLFVRDV